MKSQLALNAKWTTSRPRRRTPSKTRTYREEVVRLHDRSKVAAGKFEDLKSAGEDRWEAMVVEMDKVRDAFIHSFHYFKSQI